MFAWITQHQSCYWMFLVIIFVYVSHEDKKQEGNKRGDGISPQSSIHNHKSGRKLLNEACVDWVSYGIIRLSKNGLIVFDHDDEKSQAEE